jgi:hypothetical protein
MLLDAWMVEQDDIPGELAGWRSAVDRFGVCGKMKEK